MAGRYGARGTRQPGENELRREAARIFPKLLSDAGFLKIVAGGHKDAPAYGLYTRRNGYTRPIERLDEAVAAGFRAQGWIDRSGDRHTLSDEGLLWLRRHRAGAEPFREQHQLLEHTRRDVAGTPRPVVVNEGESPLGWLRRRKDRNGEPMIGAAQYEAGERLRADFERGHLTPSVTSKWGSAAPSRRMRRAAPEGLAALSDNAIAARERVTEALKAVGPELSGVLIDVCCHLLGLAEAEKSRCWPQRSGKVILQIALTRLARHYGLLREEREGAGAAARIRHWGAEDFRPSLERWR